MAKRTTMVPLQHATAAQLRQELSRREQRVPQLQKQHAELMQQIAAVEAELMAIGGSVSISRAARPASRPPAPASPQDRQRDGRVGPRKGSLKEAILAVLGKEKLAVPEIIERVRATGRDASSKNFRSMVSQALVDRKLFRRVSRGVYGVR